MEYPFLTNKLLFQYYVCSCENRVNKFYIYISKGNFDKHSFCLPEIDLEFSPFFSIENDLPMKLIFCKAGDQF